MTRRVTRPWRALRGAFARRLSWKLALSHLVVVLLTILALSTGVVALIFLFATNSAGWDDPLPQSDPDMQQGNRIFAALLADDVATKSPAQLAALLGELPPRESTGSGTFGGSLSPGSTLVVAAPDGTVLASSRPAEFPAGRPLEALQPPAWAPLLRNALRGERDFAPGLLQGRDEELRVLVTAYPIADERGRVIGALGLRSAPQERPRPPAGLVILASLSASVLGVLAVAAIPAGIISSIAGALVARGFGRRLRALEEATAAIARGDLARRVRVTSPDEIGRLGERFNLLAARLEAVERARRAFVSNVSHELRTPLAIIRGHVEAQLGPAREPGGAPAVAAAPPHEALEVIEREARALGGLIDDLFLSTRLEEDTLPLQPAPVAVGEVVDAAIAGIRPLALARGQIAVSSLVSPGLPPVLADRARLGQILGNLLYNALRHTPEGGVIVVEAAPVRDGAAVEIGVTDTGAGIAPADLPHIFDRFYRGEGTVRQDGSSGLGLAIVKQLVEAQGGAVGARSALGEGTTIYFTLPTGSGQSVVGSRQRAAG